MHSNVHSKYRRCRHIVPCGNHLDAMRCDEVSAALSFTLFFSLSFPCRGAEESVHMTLRSRRFE